MPPKSKSKKATTTPQNQKQPSNANHNPPNWPPLRPLLPPTDLTLTPLVTDQIYLIRNFLPGTLCKNYVSFLASLPLTTTPGKPKKDEAVRVNDRFQIEDARFAEMLWGETALRELVMERFDEGDYDYDEEEGKKEESTLERARKAHHLWGGTPLGLNSNIRVYRYSPGQFFAQHYDESNTLTFTSPSTPSPTPARTTWTLLIYLSSCTGGSTTFYPDATRANPHPKPISVAPETGLALLHRHGERCMLHEGSEVVSGEKWVLRSDLVVAR
ncbi:hypothetical protein N7474_009782 [Penicillium riverlandense]|uniref:uncharacterized protein n=1 Tax=Penicillium riverlandense TaxID=1903569 RepID=UPI0025472B5C|nr:uncharacterized protein N7474_009782 [Penicillium riverlandense]KAJ5808513.1 hypothetical protein N7474_009782 [Penicillium riverlandense]